MDLLMEYDGAFLGYWLMEICMCLYSRNMNARSNINGHVNGNINGHANIHASTNMRIVYNRIWMEILFWEHYLKPAT